MYAFFGYNAGMSSRQSDKQVQLTIRGVPSQVKKLLARKADSEKKSLNTVLVEILKNAAGYDAKMTYHDLDKLSGVWVEDPEFEAAIAAQDQVDEDLWQ